MSNEIVIGIDVGGTMVKYLVTDRTGHKYVHGDLPTDPDSMTSTLESLAARITEEMPADCGQPRAVGMACAGIVNPERGSLGRSPNLPGWANSDLGGALAAAFGGLPTILANDVNAALYGEYRFGAGRENNNLVMIALGTGVGGGVIVDGSLVSGSTCGAGEIGHIVLDLKGPSCPCGNSGCLEAYAGSTALLGRARRLATGSVMAGDDDLGVPISEDFRACVTRHGADLTPKDLCDLAVERDPTAVGVFREAGRRLGQAVAVVVNVLDPDRVIIGGGVAQAGEFLLEPCREMVRRMVLSAEGSAIEVVPAALGPFAAALGAAALASQKGADS